jgi:hypothetical protein
LSYANSDSFGSPGRHQPGSIIATIAFHTLNDALAGLAIAGVTLGWWTA